MSELKSETAYFMSLQEGENVRVYLKDEVDKIFRRLKARLARKGISNQQLEIDKNNSWHKYCQAIIELRHHKYKRCLAMAGWCEDACDKWMMRKSKAISLGKDGVEEYHRARRKLFHYMKWQTLWLKLAEKFKEAI